MTKTVLNVKTDVAVKRAAQKLAKQIGVPLSTIVNAQLKRFIDERRFEIHAPLIPNAALRKDIEDARRGRSAISPTFDDVDEAMVWLEKNA